VKKKPKPKKDPIFGIDVLNELDQKCNGKMFDHKSIKRQDYELRLARRRYVLGLEEEAP
jgi:hypothetical protein